MQTPEVPASSEFRFRARAHTRWSDEDNHGVLNNAVYLTLLEEARHAYFLELGQMRGSFFPFVLAQCNLVYLMPGRGGVDVEIETRTTGMGQTSFTQVYRMREIDSGEVWCEAEARLVCVNEKGAKQPLPDAMRDAVSALEDLAPGNQS